MFGVDDTWAWLESVATRVLNELFCMSENSKRHKILDPEYFDISDQFAGGRNFICDDRGE
jgi:hypothetical protein